MTAIYTDKKKLSRFVAPATAGACATASVVNALSDVSVTLLKYSTIAIAFVCVKRMSQQSRGTFAQNINVLISVLISRANRERPTWKPHKRWIITAGTGKRLLFIEGVQSGSFHLSFFLLLMSLLIEQLEADQKPVILPFLLLFLCSWRLFRRWRHSGTPLTNPHMEACGEVTILNPHFVLLGQELLYTACSVLWPQALMSHPEFISRTFNGERETSLL